MTTSDMNASDLPTLGPQEFSTLAHDIRHCLHVLRIGRELLITLEDPAQRQDVCQSMALEEAKATALLDQLVAIARAQVTPRSDS